MFAIEQTFKSQNEVKKSSFLAFLTPFLNFDKLHKELKEEHFKAAHIVWAYRYLNKFGQIVENQSDDKEPKGSSGPPVLNALRGARLINSAVLVVRYFGGIKLGVGGLVRAYGGAANLVISEANLVKFEQKGEVGFSTTYNLVQRIEYILNKLETKEFEREFSSNEVKWSVKITKAKLDEFLKLTLSLQELTLLYLPLKL